MITFVSVVPLRSTVPRTSKFRESLGHVHRWKRFHLWATTLLLTDIICRVSCATTFFQIHLYILKNSMNQWALSCMQKGALCADTVIGQGNTTLWKMCGLDRSTCLTVFFDISPSDRSNQPGIPNPQLYLQFVTKYVLMVNFSSSFFYFMLRLIFA